MYNHHKTFLYQKIICQTLLPCIPSIHSSISVLCEEIFDNLPFVIKIPFNGTWDYDYDYDEENDEWIERDAIFTYFNCARAFDTSDYCWNELDKIVMAYKRGYGCFFPKTAVILVNDQRFYIQEKVQVACSRRFTPTTSKDSRDKAASLTGVYRICNEDWRAAAIESYGEAILISFVNWNDAGMLGALYNFLMRQ